MIKQKSPRPLVQAGAGVFIQTPGSSLLLALRPEPIQHQRTNPPGSHTRLQHVANRRRHVRQEFRQLRHAQAQRQGNARVTALATLRCREDAVHTQAFTSVAATTSHWVAATQKALLCYERSWGKCAAWASVQKVQWDGAQTAAPGTPALAERTSANDQRQANMTAKALGEDTKHPVTDDATPR